MRIMHAIYPSYKSARKLSGKYAERNAERNAEGKHDILVQIKRPITNQGKLAHIKYEKSDIGKTGCIPIAIYNVMVLKGKKPLDQALAMEVKDKGFEGVEFEDIVEDVRALKAPLFGGRMGTDPYMIDEILRGYGIESEELTDRRSLSKAMEDAECGSLFLITQWNDMRRPLKGIHAYVVQKHANDRWACYNHVYRDYPTKAAGLTEMIGRGRLIVANYIRP